MYGVIVWNYYFRIYVYRRYGMNAEFYQKNRNRSLKRIISLILSIVMVITTVSTSGYSTKADEADARFILMINNKDAHDLVLDYGEALSISLDGYDGPDDMVTYSWTEKITDDKDPDFEPEWKRISEYPLSEPGTYYLGYNVSKSANYNNIKNYTGEYKVTIQAATLSKPDNLTWIDGGTASWDKVTKTTKGIDVSESAVGKYIIQLYKDGAACGASVEVSAEKNSCDFTEIIKSEGTGGVYTFSVYADSGDNLRYNASEVASSDVSAYAVAVSFAQDTGAQFEGTDKDKKAILIAGDTDNNSISNKAVLQSGFSKIVWRITGVAESAISLTENSGETTFTLNTDNPEGTEAVITAAGLDETLPTVTDFVGVEGGKLKAAFNDGESGVVAYAFTTKADKTALTDEDWINITATASTTITTEQSVASIGTYYAYAKDKYGNIGVAADTVNAYSVVYHNYYENNTLTEKTEYYTGDTELILAGTSRAGYKPMGWYRVEAPTADDQPVTKVSYAVAGVDSLDVYQKWSVADVSWSKKPESYGTASSPKIYDGQEHTLSAEMANDIGTVSYQWYRYDGDTAVAIDGATANEYKVKNVDDSGRYYVEAWLMVDGQRGASDRSEDVTVCIEPIDITIKPVAVLAEEKDSIEYLDAAPSYDVEVVSGSFAEGEDIDVIKTDASSINCSYTKGSVAADYTISLENYDQNSNYRVTCNEGSLKVVPKAVSDTDERVAVSFVDSEAVYAYTGEGIEPAVSITDSAIEGEDKTVPAEYYIISYEDNVSAGEDTAKVVVTFSGNYSGTVNRTFTIKPAEKSANIVIDNKDNLKYGAVVRASIDSNPSGGEEKILFARVEEGGQIGEYTETVPSNAGTYKVKGIIEATANYARIETPVEEFTIEKRTIILTSEDGNWTYDGNAHSASTVTISGDGFKPGEAFSYVQTTATITNCSESGKDNTIAWQLNDTTSIDNYVIEEHLGKLYVTKRKLVTPSTRIWSSSTPGRASWIHVIREGLDITYEVSLYRRVPGEADYELVKTITTVDNYYDFAEQIKATGEGEYRFAIKCLKGGERADNYEDSDMSELSGVISAAKVTIVAGEGIASVKLGDGTSEEVFVIAGEKLDVAATVKPGYHFDTNTNGIWSSNDYSIYFDDYKKASTKAYIYKGYGYADNIQLIATAYNDMPTYSSFDANYTENPSEVVISAVIKDSLQVKAWAISTATSASDVPASEWNEVEGTKTEENVSRTIDTAEAGEYYLYIKDDAGQICKSTDSKCIYRIDFDHGDAPEQTGMDSILKIQNKDVDLPVNTYVKNQFRFKQWYGENTGGYYADRGKYSANMNETLVAQWTDKLVSYSVNYFFMDENGTYADAETSYTFSGVYGNTVSIDDESLKLNKDGYELDINPYEDYRSSIVLDDAVPEDMVLNIYYKRNTYTVHYTYTYKGETVDAGSDTFIFGAAFVPKAVEEKPGYEFVGWVYGNTTEIPATMPGHDIEATGIYEPEAATYVVNYYTQNLDADNKVTDTYNLSSSKIYNEVQDTLLWAADNDSGMPDGSIFVEAMGIEGFSYKGVTVTTGSAGGSSADGCLQSKAATVNAVENQTVNINFYYTRNSYNLTLNVWKDEPEAEGSEKLYSNVWSIPYGANLTDYKEDGSDTAVDFAEYNKSSWTDGKDVAGYELAAYAGWSTGSLAPSTMPAGDVTVVREYVKSTFTEYTVYIHLQEAEGKYKNDQGEYLNSTQMIYRGAVGGRVTVGKGDSYDVNVNDLMTTVSSLIDGYYEYDSSVGDTEGTVKPAEDGGLALDVCFKRIEKTSTIRYYFVDTDGASYEIANGTFSAQWGSSYTVDPDLFFDAQLNPENAGNITVNQTNMAAAIAKLGGAGITFRNSPCIASISSRSAGGTKCSGDAYTGEYYSEKISTVAALQSEPSFILRRDGSNYVNLYYSAVDTAKNNLYVNVVMNGENLRAGNDFKPRKEVTFPATQLEAYDEAAASFVGALSGELPIRFVNKAYLYSNSYTDGEGTDEIYPALKYINGGYGSETGSLRAGYYRVKAVKTAAAGEAAVYYPEASYEYYTDGDYLYIAWNDNRLFAGNFTSLSLSKDMPGYTECVQKFIDDYKRDKAEEDPSAPGIYVTSNGYGSTVVKCSGVTDSNTLYQAGSCTITLGYGALTTLVYHLNGSACSNHRYMVNTTIYPVRDGLLCEHLTGSVNAGYHVEWYKTCTDGVYSDKLTADSGITMNTTKDVYGREVKDTLTCYHYSLYEAPDGIVYGDGLKASYLTDDVLAIINADENLSQKLTVNTEEVVITDFVDGAGACEVLKRDKLTYVYDGRVVRVDYPTLSLSYSPISWDVSGEVVPDGYEYDYTNAGNKSAGYCQEKAVHLSAYYKCKKASLTVINNITENENNYPAEYKVGQIVSVLIPEKAGYTFDKWVFEKKNGTDENGIDIWESYSVASSKDEEHNATVFTMPEGDIRMSAVWSPALNEFEIVHYMQKTDKSYDSSLLSRLRSITPIQLGGYDVYYDDDNNILGASYTEGDTTYYYDEIKEENTSYSVDEFHLFAAVTKISDKESDTVFNVSAYKLSAEKLGVMHTYSYTTYKNGNSITNLTDDDSPLRGQFANKPGMTVTYYYALSTNYNIRTKVYCVDGEGENFVYTADLGANIVGAGQYYYSQEITLRATIAAGYDLVGWYKPADVLDGYSEEAGFTGAGVKSNYADATPLDSVLSNYAVTVTGNSDYVLLVKPRDVAVPTITIAATNNEYTFGYPETGIDRVIRTSVVMPAGADAANNVESYKWYQKNSEGEWVDIGNSSATYNFPVGYNAGTYTYKCEAVISRADNNKSITITSEEYSITVNQKEIPHKEQNYTWIYDTLKRYPYAYIPDDTDYDRTKATIYYSETELSPEIISLLESGDEETCDLYDELIGYEDVNHNDAGEIIPNVSYYYIVSEDKNYKTTCGTLKANVIPSTVTVKANDSLRYSKEYDGYAQVRGELTEVGSQKYNLSMYDFYTIEGLYSQHQANVLDFDASFDKKDAMQATQVTLSNIVVIFTKNGEVIKDENGEPKRNYNYVIEDGFELTLGGDITQRRIEAEWSDTEFTYDGKEHKPTLSVKQLYPDDPDKSMAEQVELREGIVFDITNPQKNVGEYISNASVAAGGEAYTAQNYLLMTQSCDYKIVKRNMTVVPIDETFTYDGQAHTLTDYKYLLDGDVNSTDGLADGQICSAQPDSSYTDKGEYDVGVVNVTVKDAEGVNVTSNYNISSGTGKCTINARKVYIDTDNITGALTDNIAKDKVYDGTTKALIDNSKLSFKAAAANAGGEAGGTSLGDTGILPGDNITITGVTGTFEDANVSSDSIVGKTVTLDFTHAQFESDAANPDNYELVILDTLTTKANITPKEVKVRAENTETEYGNETTTISYSLVYDGIVEADKDNIASIISNTAQIIYKPYYIGEGDVKTYYNKFSGVRDGGYNIEISGASNLTATNYTFVTDEDREGILTVNPHPISIAQTESAKVTKSYDGTLDEPSKESVTEKNNPIDSTDYQFTGVYKSDGSTDDEINLSSYTATYDSKDVSHTNGNVVSGATKVTLSDLVIDNVNYTLSNTSFDIKATISGAALTIKPKDRKVTYGNTTVPSYESELVITGLQPGDTAVDSISELQAIGINLTVYCSYDCSDSAKRNVGDYDIVLTLVSNTSNYDIDASSGIGNGKLTVEPKGVRVKAEDLTVSYGEANPAYKYSIVSEDMVYGEAVGNISDNGSISGGVFSGAVTSYNTVYEACTEDEPHTCGYTKGSPAGAYTITPVLTGLSAVNYKFVPVTGELTVTKSVLAIDTNKIDAENKTYDGTTKAKPVIPADAITGFDSGDSIEVVDVDADTKQIVIKQGDVVIGYIYVTGAFADKNAGVCKDVQLTIEMDSSTQTAGSTATDTPIADRYTFASDSDKISTEVTVNADIEKATLTATADDKPSEGYIYYGAAAPEYTISYSGFVADETEDVITTEPTIACTYNPSDSANSSVDEYPITLSGGSADNYEFNLVNGKLTISKTKLATPEPEWSMIDVGTVKWNAVPGIGLVKVKEYRVGLYRKNGTSGVYELVTGTEHTVAVSEEQASSGAVYQYDYKEAIRSAGPGVYRVYVAAVPDTENNPDTDTSDETITYKNVGESDTGESEDTYAAEVSLVVDPNLKDGKGNPVNNLVTGFAINDTTATPTISVSYVMLQGETGVDVKAVLGPDYTGYKVSAWKNGDKAVVTGLPDAYTATVTGELSLGQNITEQDTIDGIDVPISFSLRSATLVAVVKGSISGEEKDTLELIYGYSAEGSVVLKVECGPDTASDNVDTAGYDYTYQWQIKNDGNFENISGATGDTYTLPTGKTANDYDIRCVVTATRKDNGVSVSTKNTTRTIIINRATFNPIVVINGWKYGDTKNNPTYRDIPDDLSSSIESLITYYYSTDNSNSTGDDDTTSKPTNAGTYWLYAVVAQSDNYEEVKTAVHEFRIEKAKLSAPTELQWSNSEYTSKGAISWRKVDGIEPNYAEDPTNRIDVTYTVKVYNGDTSDESNIVATHAGIPQPASGDAVSYDISSDINSIGTYKFVVIANSSNTDNCEDSDPAASENEVKVEATIRAKDTTDGSLDANNVKSKTYDGAPIELYVESAGSDSTNATYAWYKNGVLIPGAVSATYRVTDCKESAYYMCEVDLHNGSSVLQSNFINVQISKRAVTITTSGDEKTYDGTPLKKDTYTLSYGQTVGGNNPISDSVYAMTNGDTISVHIDGSITDAGTADNTVGADGANPAIIIKRGDEVMYQSGTADTSSSNANAAYNYTVNVVPGTLRINRRPLDDNNGGYAAYITVGDIADVTYKSAEYKPSVVVTDTGLASGGNRVLSVEATVNDVTTGDYKVTYSDNIKASKDDSKAKVTIEGIGNYTGSIVKEFVILPKAVSIKSASLSRKYDGTPLSSEDNTTTDIVFRDSNDTPTPLEGDDLVKAIDFTGSRTDAGTTTGGNTFTGVVIKNSSGEDVSSCYTINPIYGDITIDKRTVTLTSAEATKEYDGTPLTDDEISVGGDGFATNEGATYDVTGSQTLVGDSDNTFTYTLYDGSVSGNKATKADNYIIQTYYKKLKVTDRTSKYALTVTSKSGSDLSGVSADNKVKYDGNEYDLTGFTGLCFVKNVGSNGTTFTIVDASAIAAQTAPVYIVSGITATATVGGVVPKNVGTYTNVIGNRENVKVSDASGNDVTAQFDLSYVEGTMEITKRNVTLTSADASKAYDGKPLTANTDSDITVGGDGFASGEGYEYSITGSQTLAGNSPNAFTYTPKSGTNAGNYAVTHTYGTLTVTNRAAKYTITVISESGADVTYDGAGHEVSGLTGNKFVRTSGDVFVLADDNTYNTADAEDKFTVEGLTATTDIMGADNQLTDVVNAGTYSNIIYGTEVVKDDDGNDVSAQFMVDKVYGSLKIEQRHVTLTSATDTKEYDGTPLTNDGITVGGDGFAPNEGVAHYDVTGSQLVVGSSDNEFAYTLYDGTASGTKATLASNYDIDTVEGTLTVTDRTNKYEITVTANSDTKVFDRTEHSVDGFETLTFGINVGGGTVTYLVSGISASARGTNAGIYSSIVTGTVIVKDEYGNDVTGQFDVDMTDGELVIQKATTMPECSSRGYDELHDGNKHSIAVTVNDADASTIYYAEEPMDASNYGTVGSTDNPEYSDIGEYTVYYYVASPNYNAGNVGSEIVRIRPNSYTISFDGAGDEVTGLPEDMTKTQKIALTLPEEGPEYADYIFAGWSKTPKASEAEYETGGVFDIDADTVLYPVWLEKISGTVTFDYNYVDPEDMQNKVANEHITKSVVVLYYMTGTESVELQRCEIDIDEPVDGVSPANPYEFLLRPIYVNGARANYIVACEEADGTDISTYGNYNITTTDEKGRDFLASYNPDCFRINWIIDADPTAITGDEQIPSAVRVKICYKETNDQSEAWKIITQHENSAVVSMVNASTYQGGYLVWKWNSAKDCPYYYSYIVTEYYMDGEWVDAASVPYLTLDIYSDDPDITPVFYNGSAFKADGGVNSDGIMTGTLHKTWFYVDYDTESSTTIIEAQKKYYGVEMQISDDIPVREGYEFVGWNDKEDGTGTMYQPGDRYTLDKSMVLFAQWKRRETVPETEVIPGSKDKTGNTDDLNGAPKTGDDSIPIVWLFGVVLSGAGLTYLAKKKCEEED